MSGGGLYLRQRQNGRHEIHVQWSESGVKRGTCVTVVADPISATERAMQILARATGRRLDEPAATVWRSLVQRMEATRARQAQESALERERVDEVGETERLCSRCKEYWPADGEFFYSTGRKSSRLHCWCRACYAEWKAERAAPAKGRPS